MSIVALIPARGGSKGIKKKNLVLLNNRPLIAHTIENAKSSSFVDRVIVSTDDNEIAAAALEYGAEVPFIRPKSLADDHAKSIDVISHTIKELDEKMDDMILLQPTSPLRTTKHIDEAIKQFYDENRTPLISVSEAAVHPNIMKKLNDGKLVDYLENKPDVTRRQDFETIYQINGAIYITTKEMVLNKNKIYDTMAIPYIMDKISSVDIDDIYDLYLAEILMNKHMED
ncbi:cytidylyltransferase domain-containing protein [Gracilibacillus kekensis]|uniref:CMP-N,N'-diacetyllegionaminic acid synthase n=1 Tax=Gracilibacillus kekensis TaxID=1027249 RepID=A0A1M7K736_9BACI|nr:acylneuraminate cytidylyltransferase family protein [Gracilibacillus kekensis]SHM61119.1 CMP-N,N'-diacetyllegionaminic acid synthase [Gracilibacillus kekensis]